MDSTETIQLFDRPFRIDLSEWEKFRFADDYKHHYRSRQVHGLFMQFTEINSEKHSLDYLKWARQQALNNGLDLMEVSDLSTEGPFHYYLITNLSKQYPVVSLICAESVDTNAFPVITFILMNSNSEEEIGEAFMRFVEKQS